MEKKSIIILMVLVGMTICFAFQLPAQDIKANMLKRLPIIKELKIKGIVGENNRGYLEFIGTVRDKEEVVSSENADRKQVYAAIAANQGTTLEVVEKHRAAQIERKAEPGEWLQDAAGLWYQKR